MTDTDQATRTVAPTLARLAVPISSLRPHPRNPRRGDLEAVKDSLRHHGQYRPIVANRRTGEVLARNHVLRAASELGDRLDQVHAIKEPDEASELDQEIERLLEELAGRERESS